MWVCSSVHIGLPEEELLGIASGAILFTGCMPFLSPKQVSKY